MDEPKRTETSTKQSFEDAHSWHLEGPQEFAGNVDGVWSQGRAIYGGIVGAGMVRAMAQTVSKDRTLRSLAITFAGPVEEGLIECNTRLIREGRTASFVGAEITQEGSSRASATATFGIDRPMSLTVDGPPRPDAPPPEEVVSIPYIEGLTPSFTQMLELRYTRGQYPFSGSKSSTLEGWFRFRYDSTPADGASIVGLVDAWPCPAITMLQSPAFASSITWNVDLWRERLDCRVDEWWYYQSTTTFAGSGYTSFDASVWAPDGGYVARSRQLVGVFEPRTR